MQQKNITWLLNYHILHFKISHITCYKVWHLVTAW